jgi:hypothetical protein
VLAHLKRWPEAVSFADRATAISRALSEKNPSVKQFSGLLNVCFSNQVEVAEASGDKAAAQVHREEADNSWRTHPSIERLSGFFRPGNIESAKANENREQSP